MDTLPVSPELRLIPQTIKDNYTHFKFSYEASYYRVYQAISNSDGAVYSIRVLNTDCEFYKKSPDAAATLFLREIMYLCMRLKLEDIKLEHFCISQGLIAFILPQYFPLSQTLTPESELNIDLLLHGLKEDLHFLQNTLYISKKSIKLEDVYQINEGFLIGDWASAEESNQKDTEASLQENLKKLELSGQTINKSAWQFQESAPWKLAWCSFIINSVSIYDSKSETLSHFDGTKIEEGCHTLIQQIPNSPYLISSNYAYYEIHSGFEIFDLSNNFKSVFSIEPTYSSNIWDIACNARTNRVALFSIADEVAYHLIDGSDLNKKMVKAAWHKDHSEWIASLTFNDDGDRLGLVDADGLFLVVDVDTNTALQKMQVGRAKTGWTKCRWNKFNPQIAISFDKTKLNFIDPNKQTMLLSKDADIHNDWITCIDWEREGSLLASSSRDRAVKIFDMREGKVVKNFEGLHTGFIDSVKWSPCGKFLATASSDTKVNLFEFATGKITHQWHTIDKQEASSVCFLEL